MRRTLQISFNPSDPVFEPKADFWGLNAFHLALPPEIKPAAWFQIHREEDLINEVDPHLAWLRREHEFPIFMAEQLDKYPSSVKLPLKDLESLWPFKSRKATFGSSFDYMLALAAVQGYKRVVHKNMNLLSYREAMLEAPSFMQWVGIVGAGCGVEVDLGDSRLAYTTHYGLEHREIPSWVPYDVALDMIVDYSSETRRRRKLWQREAAHVGNS